MLSAQAGSDSSIAEARRAARAGLVGSAGAQAGASPQPAVAGLPPLTDAGLDAGAGAATAVAASSSNDAGTAPATAAPSAAPVQPDTGDVVFRDDSLTTYALTFSSADWERLQKTALEEVYVPALLSVEGVNVGKVGVRYKGAYTLSECFMDGKQTCRKASMKVKFDEYDQELRYHGLKRLNFHSALMDRSHLRERVSYQVFRNFGVLAPRSVHARVVINGSYAGLYNLTEEVDGRFTDHHFSGAEGDGTLYKEVWPSSSQDPAYFSKGQQTNEGAPVAKLVTFATELAAAKSDKLAEVVTRWMDADYTLRYLAVHTVVKHWDGPLTFWCAPGRSCVNHNYFLYESPTQNRFSIVAWDMDNTFYDDTQTDVAEVPQWYEPASECIRNGSSEFLAPACDRLVRGFNQLGHDALRETLAKLLAGPFQVAALQSDIDRWAKQIDAAVKSDPHGSGYDDWKAQVAGLRAAVATFHARAAALRDDKTF